MSVATISAPARANATAIARPIPRACPQPVIGTTLPSNSLTERPPQSGMMARSRPPCFGAHGLKQSPSQEALATVWTNGPSYTFWRSISKDNVTTWYGKRAESRIADPADPTRVFSWLICESCDDKGNAIAYEYKAEDSTGVDVTQVQ
jgi:hypothetical protein